MRSAISCIEACSVTTPDRALRASMNTCHRVRPLDRPTGAGWRPFYDDCVGIQNPDQKRLTGTQPGEFSKNISIFVSGMLMGHRNLFHLSRPGEYCSKRLKIHYQPRAR